MKVIFSQKVKLYINLYNLQPILEFIYTLNYTIIELIDLLYIIFIFSI